MRPHSRAAAVLAAVASLFAAPRAAQAVLDVQLVVGNLAYVLDVEWAPGDTSRMFLLDRFGRVLVFRNGGILPTPFLDITGETLPDYGEQGLLGMAFDPGYDTNGLFYVYFIRGTPGGGGNGVSTIRRYQVSAGNPDVADTTTAYAIFSAAQPQTNHNGGTITFGPDGNLWLGLGDGGTGGFRSQDLGDPMGKMLRMDVHADDFPADPARNYAIPPDNPFVGVAGARPEVWAYGFRNPYRFNFDRLTGDLWIGDVGQYQHEEIDFQAASSAGGENYGWDRMEGFSCYSPPTGCNDGSLTLPVYDYPHANGGCYSVTGGVCYRGTALGPNFQGTYFFADYCASDLPGYQGRVWSFEYGSGTVTNFTEWTVDLDPPGFERLILIGSIAEDPDGEIYLVEYRASSGKVWKIVPEPGAVGAPDVAQGEGLRLLPGRPNPFRDDVQWSLSLARPGPVAARVVDATGRLVRRLTSRPEGSAVTLSWDGRTADGRSAAAGVYFLRVDAGGAHLTDSVTRLR